jgi:hypothetical protein
VFRRANLPVVQLGNTVQVFRRANLPVVQLGNTVQVFRRANLPVVQLGNTVQVFRRANQPVVQLGNTRLDGLSVCVGWPGMDGATWCRKVRGNRVRCAVTA